MKNIAVIYGGMSVEHEVSIITGQQILDNIDTNLYKASPLYIDKDGDWFYGDKLRDISIYKEWKKKYGKKFTPDLDRKNKKNILNKFDAIVVACHGNFGEDGRLQGIFDFLDIPYTSSGVVGSASGMDKIVMKSIFQGINLPVLPYIWFTKDEWLSNKTEMIKKVHYTLDYPVFVKPANLGSSIGISMANNENELINAVNIASQYDYRIIIEKGISPSVEINCSAIMKNKEVITSVLEEPVRWDTFLSFEDKYINSNGKTKGMSSMGRKIPAEVSDEIKKHISEYTKLIYKTMDCNGVIRVDFLLDQNKEHVFVNEVNTIPGSFSFYLWEYNNLQFKDLITTIIQETINQNSIRKDKILRYDSTILNKLSKNGNKMKGSKI